MPRRTRSRAASGSHAASRSRAGSSSIVSAGTSDGPVVREARIRAELLGTTVVVHEDVGVAGVHRLAAALPDSSAPTASSSSRAWTARSRASSAGLRAAR